MCNCKGYDVAYWVEEFDIYTIEPHFCRLLDDCGHPDNTLEEAADQVASSYRELMDRYLAQYEKAKDNWYKWAVRVHPDYLHYKEDK